MVKNTNTVITSIWILFMLVLLLFSRANAVAPDQSPVALIKSRNERVSKILEKAGPEVNQQTKEQLKDVINSFIDFRELSKIALGKYWDERGEKEKADFTEVFKQLIRNSSVKKLEVYKADKIEYDDPVITGDKAVVTTYAFKDRKEVEVQYKMHLADGAWKVYDMVIDGVSTALNYRDSFYKQIAKTSYKEMYDKLANRLAESE